MYETGDLKPVTMDAATWVHDGEVMDHPPGLRHGIRYILLFTRANEGNDNLRILSTRAWPSRRRSMCDGQVIHLLLGSKHLPVVIPMTITPATENGFFISMYVQYNKPGRLPIWNTILEY